MQMSEKGVALRREGKSCIPMSIEPAMFLKMNFTLITLDRKWQAMVEYETILDAQSSRWGAGFFVICLRYNRLTSKTLQCHISHSPKTVQR